MLLTLVALILGSATAARAQVYAGAAAGIGGARVPIGSNTGGFRGTLRLYGGYEFNPHVAAEAMTLDLGTPDSKPAASTIGAFGVAIVGTLPTGRLRFDGRLGVMSMDGRVEGRTTKRTAQGMVGIAIGFAVVPRLTIGIETAVSRVEFTEPVGDAPTVSWTAAGLTYRF